jgi:hypothetical protein
MIKDYLPRLTVACSFAIVIIVAGVGSAVPFATTSATGADFATATSSETCSGDVQQKAEITQSSIQATDDQITTTQPGLISGQIVAPQSNQCVVVVQMVLTIPTDMYVAGTDDVGSGGQGKLSSTFRMSPGEVESMSAQVYASSPGTRVLMADFLYYPAGHPDNERRLNGFGVKITATESNMPGNANTDSTTLPILLVIGGCVSLILPFLLMRQ